MLLELLHKEFKESQTYESSKVKTILRWVGRVLVYGLIVFLEVFIFSKLEPKLKEFSSFGSYDFLILILFVMLIVSMISTTLRAREIFYKRIDSSIMLHLPINNDEIIFSKALFTYLNNVLTSAIITIPLLFTFGIKQGFESGITTKFYVFSVLYPFFSSFISTGLTLIILPLYNKAYNFIKPKPILQIALGSILVITLCILYNYVLNLFMTLVNDAKLDTLISGAFVEKLHKATKFFVPTYQLMDLGLGKVNVLQDIMISVGSSVIALVLGYFIATESYTNFLKGEFSSNESKTMKSSKILLQNPTKTLLKKEFVLIFRNSNYVFSYTSLLIMQPFLAFVVINSLNTLFYTNQQMFLHYYGEFINALNITLILLFSSIIASSTMDAYSREQKAIQIVKYIPISPLKQTICKMIIPFAFSSFSLILTLLVLAIGKQISVLAFFISLLAGLMLLLSLSVAGVYIDLAKLNENKKSNIEFLSTVLSIVLPLITFGLIFLFMYAQVSKALMYIIVILLYVITNVALILPFKKIINNSFIKMRI
ncbi:MAG: hypothetical protein IJ656_01625 [Bacilli bacterium]|nr:hypothetical protein [Bacilli bacterium]